MIFWFLLRDCRQVGSKEWMFGKVARDRFKYRFKLSGLRRDFQFFLRTVLKMSFKRGLIVVAEFKGLLDYIQKKKEDYEDVLAFYSVPTLSIR